MDHSWESCSLRLINQCSYKTELMTGQIPSPGSPTRHCYPTKSTWAAICLLSLIFFMEYINQTIPRFYKAGSRENLIYWRLSGDLGVKLSFLPEVEESPSLLWSLSHLLDVLLIDRALCHLSPFFVDGLYLYLNLIKKSDSAWCFIYYWNPTITWDFIWQIPIFLLLLPDAKQNLGITSKKE